MHRFWDIRLVSIQWPWNPGRGSLKVIGTDTYRFATYNFLLAFHSNDAPISYRFWDIRRFQSKIAKFSHPPLLFCVPAEGIPLGIGYRRWDQKTRMMGLPGQQRSLTIYSAIWIECMNVTDRRTDRHRATAKTALTHSVACVSAIQHFRTLGYGRQSAHRLALIKGLMRCHYMVGSIAH